MTEGDPNTVAAHSPNCGAEYRAGFDTCADCGVALEPGPAPTEPDTPPQPRTDAWAEATHRVWDRKPEEGHPEPVELCQLPTDEPHLGAGPAIRASRVWVHKARLEEAQQIQKEFIERQAYE